MFPSTLQAIAARSALGIAAGLCLLVGLTLLSTATGLVLAQAYSVEFALTMLGLLYLGAGLVLVAMVWARKKTRPQNPMQDVAQAFFSGLGAGTAARQGFDTGRRPG